MNIIKKDIDQNNAVITVSVEKADYAEKVEKQIRDFRKKVQIPGFRPGMAPIGLIKKMYEKTFLSEELNKLVSESVNDYIQQHKLLVLGEPMLSNTEQQPINIDVQDTFDFVFDVGIAPKPDFTLTKDDKVNFYHIIIEDRMIDAQIGILQAYFGARRTVETVQETDIVKGLLVELENNLPKEDGIVSPDATIMPTYIQSETCKNELIGSKVGDTIVVNPAEMTGNKYDVGSLLGIDNDEAENINADFRFTISEITRYQKAEINQELFDRAYGDGVVGSEEDFRNKIKEELASKLAINGDFKFRQDLRELLLEKCTDMVFPETFLKRWMLATKKEATPETVDEDYPQIIGAFKWKLILEKITENTDIKVEDVEVQEYARKMVINQLTQFGMEEYDERIVKYYAQGLLKKDKSFQNIANRVYENKVLDSLKDKITVEETDISVADFNKLFAKA
ncbi:MAG: trigger factor [Prevotellaceae bacterium]|jgi:trigger factor|nr:trigger factor [Prevotellaceae bacterium]